MILPAPGRARLASWLLAVLLAQLGACSRPLDVASLEPEQARDEIRARGWEVSEEGLDRRAVQGDLEGLQLYLRAGFDPNVFNGRPLSLAAARGDEEVVDALLRGGADPNRVGSTGANAPLLNACINGDATIVDLLLAAGADPDVDGPGGTPPLMFVKDADLARRLLSAGADPDGRDAKGQTPLMAAVSLGDPAIVELLLARGADPDLGDDAGRTPLLLATALKFDAMVARLRDAGAHPLHRRGLSQDEIELYAGRYGSSADPVVVAPDRGHLYIVEETREGGLYEAELFPLGDDTFYRDRDPAAVPYRFERDGAGRVVGLRALLGAGDTLLERVEDEPKPGSPG